MGERNLFLNYLAQTSENPHGLVVKSANGHYITDTNNKSYFDLISGISVCNLGHNPIAIKEAVVEQFNYYSHVMVYGEYIQPIQNKLATSLNAVLPKHLHAHYFLNSGGEAIDAAMKLAKRATKKSGFVAQTLAYHGSSQGPASLMSDSYYTEKYRPLLPNIYFQEQNNIESLANLPWNNIAGFILEVVQAEKGCEPCTLEYLKAVREYCNKHCVLLIYDEIQTGMFRTGKFFAMDWFEVYPDILITGKALGGGLPISALSTSKSLLSLFSHSPILGHITTFGGNPITCAAAKAAITETIKLGNTNNILAIERIFKELENAKHVLKVAGKGLLLAVHLPNFEFCLAVIKKLQLNGILTDWFLFASNAIRIAPPITITKIEAESIKNTIFKILSEIE